MNVKHGFSTLNRLLGKKNKGYMSKSTTNLSLSPQHENSSSQLEQNRITPLSIATTNAPFEQTFRITVLLPKGQLYVSRLGAKTKLQKLLEIVCENKQLDQKKYEFRHPVDSSQVFSCELTIGAVGLNEIRLCHKSETYDNFNSDEIIKLRHTGRDSLSSSELSSRNSKNTLKTPSPYSSTNSLNSIDSTGMSTSYRGQVASLPPMSNSLRSFVQQQSNVQQPPVAPARKKRAAPRPPSQNSIPEKEPVNGYSGNNVHESVQSIPRREFHVSSPNLMIPSAEFSALRLPDFHKSNLSVDCNGNVSNDHHFLKGNHSQPSTEYDGLQNINTKNQPISVTVINDEVSQNNTYNGSLNSIKVENRNDINFDVINCSTETLKVPEPVPRKKTIAGKKKAPAPPPRTLCGPVALPRNSTVSNQQKTIDNAKQVNKCGKAKSNESCSHETFKNMEQKFEKVKENHIQEEIKQEKLHTNTIPKVEVLNKDEFVIELDKKERVLSSVSQSSVSDISKDYTKPSFESSSDDDENIKVYNLKLGKMTVKPFMEHKTYEDLSTLSSLSNEFMSDEENKSSGIDSETKTLTYKIPASPNSTDNLSVSSDKISIESDVKKMNLCKIDSDGSKYSSDISDSSLNIEKDSTNTEQQTSVVSEILKNDETLDNLKKIFTSNTEEESSERNYKNNRITNKIDNKNENNIKNKSETVSELVACEIKQNDVITELNVLNGNKLNTNIPRSEGVEEIDLLQTCGLSNFKIQSYTSVYDPVRTFVDLSDNNNEFNTPSIGKSKTTKDKENNQSTSLELIVQQHFSNKNKNNVMFQQNNDTLEKDHITCSEQDKTPVNQSLFEGNISIEFDNNNLKKCNSRNKHEELSTQNVEEERLYKKHSNNDKGNINPQIFKSRVNITRSDSFHSTRYPNSSVENSNKSGISLRSLSSVSLLNAQNYEQNMQINLNQSLTDTHRRKSSSELSIRESPNLQSLIIMKSILNSRKSSLSTEDDLQQNGLTFISKSYMSDYTDNTKITRISYDENDNSKENLPKNTILYQENITNDIKNIQKENKEEYKKPEKRWTYQGPPSINLTSWNERPKIQVSIKNDGDYKFGIGGRGVGGTSTSITTFPRVYRNSLASTIATTCSTQSQNQKQCQQLGSCNTQINPLKIIDQSKVPFVRNIEFKKPTTPIDFSASPKEVNSIVHNNPNFEIKGSNTTTMTLGRIPKMINRTETFTPIVRNFKTSSTAENDYTSLKTKSFVKTSETVNDVYKNNPLHQKIDLKTQKSVNNLGRSNSVTITYSTKYPTENKIHEELYKNYNEHNNNDTKEKGKDNSVENPFSKVVLRKTGLKEKIMSISNEQQFIPSKLVKTDDQDCAKLELKLKTHIQKPKTLTKPTKQSPPPPPPPIIRSVVTKQQIGSGNFAVNKCIPNSRDELLSAIRNFNKEILKRS